MADPIGMYFQQAQLSMAAYADLTVDMDLAGCGKTRVEEANAP